MNKIVRFAAFACVALPGYSYGQQSLQFSAGIDVNYKHLSSNFISVVPAAGPIPLQKLEESVKANIWTVNVNPAIAWRGLFLAAAFERTLGEATTRVDVTTTFANGTGGHSTTTGTVRREENSVTLGYDLWKGVTPFVGYFQNRTDLYTANYTQDFYYREYGPYYGFGYSHGFEGGGRLGMSFAYARANGTVTSRPGQETASSMSGTLTGTSIGISWNAPISSTVSYRIGYKATRYKFKLPGTQFGDLDAAEDYDALYLGLVKYF